MGLNAYAQALGYENWADYQSKMRQAKAEAKARQQQVKQAQRREKQRGTK